MKKIIFLLMLGITVSSCKPENHYHDGKYHTKLQMMGITIEDINCIITGNQIEVNNSISGISKFECTQFEDRIEYKENDGVTRVLYFLENGDLKFNDQIILIKTNFNDKEKNK